MKHFGWLSLVAVLVGCGQPAPNTMTDGLATEASPLALSADGRTLWVVNPDADSVTPVDVSSLSADPPIAVGDEPWSVAASPLGVVVMNRADGTISLLDQGRRVDIEVGPEPGGVALSPSGKLAYVTISSGDEVVVVDLASREIVKRIPVGRMPWSIAVTDDGDIEDDDETVVVTHRFARLRPGGQETQDDGKEGWLSVIRGDQIAEVAIAPYEFGYANVLEGLAVQGDQLFVTHQLNAPELPRDFEHTVSAALSMFPLSTNQELSEQRLHINDSDFSTPVNFPRAIAVSLGGAKAYVVLAGTDAVMGIDLQKKKLIGFWGVGKNPRGIVLDKDGKRAFVMNHLSRDISVLDLSDEVTRKETARITVSPETLDARILQGKILFNNAHDPRLSHLGWISCASCHPDGGVDGTTWLTPDGPRQTQPLWNLEGTAPFHASATRDEVQDFEHDIEGLMDGIGLAAGIAPRELGEPGGGKSADLDALAEFVLKGIRVPKALKADALAVERGREVFARANCQTCHGGQHWTNSQLPGAVGTLAPGGEVEVKAVLRDVGTYNPQADVLGVNGFDVPTLLGVFATAPYFHDGSAESLFRVLQHPQHGPRGLDAHAQADLVAFLEGIDLGTQPFR